MSVRVYRDPISGTTWIERGAGSPVIAIADHGDEITRQWHGPSVGALVYDDELHAVEHETTDEAVSVERRRIRDLVAAAQIPAPAKATVRKIIGEDS